MCLLKKDTFLIYLSDCWDVGKPCSVLYQKKHVYYKKCSLIIYYVAVKLLLRIELCKLDL